MASMKMSTAGALLLLLASCQTLPKGAACWALDGRALFPPALEGADRDRREAELATAQAALAKAPHDRDAAVWVARRLGYLGRYREAIDVLTEALVDHPGDAFLLRHRGHRWITLREFGKAAADLERAAVACRLVPDEIEPDGRPSDRPPHSSLHYNVHYHLGLALFLCGDFALAERAWLDCLAVVWNDESRVAVTHWLWCVRSRLGDKAGAAAVVAPIRPDMDVVDNKGYHQLCLFYAGKLRREDIVAPKGSAGAVLAFGLAHQALVLGAREQARREFEMLAKSDGWTAFGVIAAEADLARLR